MMRRSRERCNLYTRVYLGTQTHVRMHTVSRVSLSTRKRSTWAQRIIGSHSAPELPTASVRPPRLPSTQVCVLLCPTVPYINSAQFETYRRCLLLCVFTDSSRVKPVFIAIRTPLNPLPRHGARCVGAGTCSLDEKSPGSGFQRARSGEIRPRHVFTAIRYIYWLPRCATWLISHRTHCCWKRICHLRISARIDSIDYVLSASIPHVIECYGPIAIAYQSSFDYSIIQDVIIVCHDWFQLQNCKKCDIISFTSWHHVDIDIVFFHYVSLTFVTFQTVWYCFLDFP